MGLKWILEDIIDNFAVKIFVLIFTVVFIMMLVLTGLPSIAKGNQEITEGTVMTYSWQDYLGQHTDVVFETRSDKTVTKTLIGWYVFEPGQQYRLEVRYELRFCWFGPFLVVLSWGRVVALRQIS